MNENIGTALREFIEIIKDREWHDLYEFHDAFRLSAAEIFSATAELLRFEIIIKSGHRIRLSDNLQNKQLSIINRLQKTKRPKALDQYDRST